MPELSQPPPAPAGASGYFEPLRVLAPGEAPPPTVRAPGSAVCPTCEGRPTLERFPRYELITYEPLLFCHRCYGFWARGDSLSRGAADERTEHPALRQMPIQPRCTSCFGRLDDQLVCRKCGQRLPPIPCPACDVPMVRAKQDGVLLDACTPCAGIWFETGELPRMFGLTGYPPTLLERMGPPPSLADGREETPAGWGVVIPELIALALRFLPLP